MGSSLSMLAASTFKIYVTIPTRVVHFCDACPAFSDQDCWATPLSLIANGWVPCPDCSALFHSGKGNAIMLWSGGYFTKPIQWYTTEAWRWCL